MYIISSCKSYDAMFLPVGKSDAPRARCVPLARCKLKFVIARYSNDDAVVANSRKGNDIFT